MQIEKRHSYGVIPLFGTPDVYEVLLIEQKDPNVLNYWTLPKGTPEAGETPLETAIRETKEEVGIVCDEIDETFSFTDSYEFTRGDVLIQKSVTYFVGRAPSKDFVVQEKEVNRALWCTFEKARELMKFKRGNAALDILEEKGVPARLLATKSV